MKSAHQKVNFMVMRMSLAQTSNFHHPVGVPLAASSGAECGFQCSKSPMAVTHGEVIVSSSMLAPLSRALLAPRIQQQGFW